MLVSPLAFILWLFPKRNKRSVFAALSQFLSLFPGKLGSYIRNSFYHLTMTKKTLNGTCHFGTIFSDPDVTIEDNVYIGPQCNIGQCSIGKDTLIASGVHILSGKNQHSFNDLDTPIQQQGGEYQKITIGKDCWVGNGALIMANVGNQSIIAAGSVVINDVPDYAVVAGNPAKIIKQRN